jgi:hypothetical protein
VSAWSGGDVEGEVFRPDAGHRDPEVDLRLGVEGPTVCLATVGARTTSRHTWEHPGAGDTVRGSQRDPGHLDSSTAAATIPKTHAARNAK